MEGRLAGLELFYGELTPNRAVVHARLPVGKGESLTLAGLVRGPRCSRGSTLPATYRIVPRGPLAPRAEEHSRSECTTLITDPIFWSPDWPALYDAKVELRQGSEVLEVTTRTIGLRPLAVSGRSLSYGGKTWILRGVQRTIHVAEAVNECRQHSAALVAPVELLDARMLTQASEAGVLVVPLLPGQTTAEENLVWLSQHAAVAIAVLPPDSRPFRSPQQGNILLAHHVKQGDEEPPADNARLVLGEVLDPATYADWAATLRRTVIAQRQIRDNVDVGAARAECDRLQRDLAPGGQYAGYVV